MIEKNEINGRPCVVVYLDSHFKPVHSQDEAELARVVFTDDEGGTMFLVPKDIGLG